ncbi:MAG: phenylacetic acid degradation operon negative regulatory protein, partial [Phenylobacterium sp.]
MMSDFLTHRAKVANISSKSHLVTVFGDVMSQHGEWIWLGSLISALQPLGFSERLVRTSVFRLVQDDWLQTQKVGRRSYYAFTNTAKRHYEKAARRIYAGEVPAWDGSWLIVIPAFVGDDKLVSFRRQLNWLGFSPLASGVYAHPSFDKRSLEETIEEMALS